MSIRIAKTMILIGPGTFEVMGKDERQRYPGQTALLLEVKHGKERLRILYFCKLHV